MNRELIDALKQIESDMAPAPWSEDAVHAAIRHVQRNTEIMDEYEGTPNRYDGGSMAKLRNLLPEIIKELEASHA